MWERQGGITCGAIDELRKSSKTIDERVVINLSDKNVVIARFRDKTAYVFGVFAIGKTLRYRGIRFPGSPVPRFPGSSVPRFPGSPVPPWGKVGWC